MMKEDMCYFIHCSSLSFGSFLSPTPCNCGNWDWEPLRWHKYRASWGLPLPPHGKSMPEQGSQYRRDGIPRIKDAGIVVPDHSSKDFGFYLKSKGSHEAIEEITQETSMVIYLQMLNITLTTVWTIVWRETEYMCKIHFRGYCRHSGKKSRLLLMGVFPDQYKTL